MQPTELVQFFFFSYISDAKNIICCFQSQTLFRHVLVCLLSHPLQSQAKRKETATRRITRTTARCVSRVERSSCATLVLELTTSSV